MDRLGFTLERTATDSQARAGRFHTRHGAVQTPLFMPVGTLASVRAQTNETLSASGSQVLLANTYHLMQTPGLDVLERFGDVHRFMKWNGPILTDSGGFQIFSLSAHRDIREAGATFRTFEGRRVFLSPETSIEAQRIIGSDIMMVLDECIDANAPYAEARRAMELTHRWAERSLRARGDSPQALFAIVQGACHDDLRVESARTLRTLPFDGFAIGGLAVGEPREERERVVALTTPHMPPDRPRYLMGVGTAIDLLEAVHRGIDMFDCILPTAYAAHGLAFTSRGRLRLRRGVYRHATGPLDPSCSCPTCRVHDRAYLSHLVKTKEPMGWSLVGQHNLYFFHALMRRMRQAILEDRFTALYRELRNVLDADDLDNPVTRPAPRTSPAPEPPRARGRFLRLGRHPDEARIVDSDTQKIVFSANAPVDIDERAFREALITQNTPPAPLVVETGELGSGAHAMALIRLHEALAKEVADSDLARLARLAVRPLVVRSVVDRPEGNDVARETHEDGALDAFALACEAPALFPHLKHPAPHDVARRGEWRSADRAITWEVHPLHLTDGPSDGRQEQPSEAIQARSAGARS